MAHYIDKDALVAEIKKIKSHIGSDKYLSDFEKGCNFGREDVCDSLLNFIDTLEVKDANEALRTEYEKGRADAIAKTLEWINVFNDNNYIMQYSDPCEHPINEIIEWYKNYINRE